MRQKIFKSIFLVFSVGSAKKHLEIGGTELDHNLSANAAGGTIAARISPLAAANGERRKFPLALTYRLKERHSFGAYGGSKGGIFNI